jgi:hypothetical protein
VNPKGLPIGPPTVTEPKVTPVAAVDKLAGVMPVPVPLKVTVPPGEAEKVNVVEREPVVLGVNDIRTLQLAPAARPGVTCEQSVPRSAWMANSVLLLELSVMRPLGACP